MSPMKYRQPVCQGGAVTLPRDEVLEGLVGELSAFEELVRSIAEREWALPTRCEGWTVADVAAERLEVFADPQFPERQAAERRGRSAAEVADELRDAAKIARDIGAGLTDEVWDGPGPAGVGGTLGGGVEAIWYDAYVHADDIRAALGRRSVGGPGLRAAVAHLSDLLTDKGWGPAVLALDGLDEFPVGGGGGRRVTGDPLAFVLAATGRQDPATIGLDPAVNVYG